MSFLGGLILDAINGQGQNAAGGSRSRSRTQSQSRTRPKAWEPFQQQGQRSTNPNRNKKNDERREEVVGVVQGIIGNIIGAAKSGGWLDAARNAMDGFQNVGAADNGERARRRTQPGKKAKTKARSGVR